MKRILTLRDNKRQQAHLWEGHRIEDEVAACSDRTIARVFLDLLPKNEEILEAGCGLGAWVIFLQKRGYRISGIDNNTAVIGQLKQWDPGLRVFAGDILRLPQADQALGAYISLGVVEHFEDGPEPPLREALRVLRPEGLLVFTVPFNNIFRRLIAHPLREGYLFFHRLTGRRAFFAEYRYSRREVQRMIEEAGFVIQDISTDDFATKTRSLTLWSEFPFLRSRKGPYLLNVIGKSIAWIFNTVSRNILSSGILIIARKP